MNEGLMIWKAVITTYFKVLEEPSKISRMLSQVSQYHQDSNHIPLEYESTALSLQQPDDTRETSEPKQVAEKCPKSNILQILSFINTCNNCKQQKTSH